MGSELSCTPGKQGGEGEEGGARVLSPFPLLVSPRFFSLREFFSLALQSERLEQANPIVDPLFGPSILRKGSSPADNLFANTRKGCKRKSNNCPHKHIAEGYCAGDLNCRPRHKYHVKSPKYVSGNSLFFSKYLEKF